MFRTSLLLTHLFSLEIHEKKYFSTFHSISLSNIFNVLGYCWPKFEILLACTEELDFKKRITAVFSINFDKGIFYSNFLLLSYSWIIFDLILEYFIICTEELGVKKCRSSVFSTKLQQANIFSHFIPVTVVYSYYCRLF